MDTIRAPVTQAEALEHAGRLYDRLYRDLRADISEEQWAALDGFYRSGTATLETLAHTAATLPMRPDTQELVAGYLEGPADDDLEGRWAWMTLLPELFADIRRAEEAEHTALLGDFVLGATAMFSDDWAGVEAAFSPFDWPMPESVRAFDEPTAWRFDEFPFVDVDLKVDWIDVTPTIREPAADADEAAGEPAGNMSYALAA